MLEWSRTSSVHVISEDASWAGMYLGFEQGQVGFWRRKNSPREARAVFNPLKVYCTPYRIAMRGCLSGENFEFTPSHERVKSGGLKRFAKCYLLKDRKYPQSSSVVGNIPITHLPLYIRPCSRHGSSGKTTVTFAVGERRKRKNNTTYRLNHMTESTVCIFVS